MLLWEGSLKDIQYMEVVKIEAGFSILINGEYIIREFSYDKPYLLDTKEEAYDLMNEYQIVIDALKTSLKRGVKHGTRRKGLVG